MITPEGSAIPFPEEPVPNVAPEVADLQQAGMAGRVLRGLVIAGELSIANEAIRYGAFGAAQAAFNNPAISAAALGGTTMLVEGAAALAVAPGIQDSRALRWLSERLTKFGLTPEVKAPFPVKAATAYMLGTVVTMAVKAREEPDFTPEQSRRYGLKTAAALSGVLAVQGFMASKGIEQPSKETVGFALLGVAAPFVVARRAVKKFRRNT